MAVFSTALVLLATGTPAWAQTDDGDTTAAPEESVAADRPDEAATEQPPPEQPAPDPPTSDPPAESSPEPEPSDGAGSTTADGAGAADASTTTNAQPFAPADEPADVGIDVGAAATGEDSTSETPESPGPAAVSEQAVTVTGVAVAIATTGGNEIETTTPDPPASGGSGGTTHVETGRANAVGSRDETSVEQQAVTVLSGEAAADILQVVLVFNIGAALANSGVNAIAAGGTTAGTSSTSTGSAVAVGNNAQTYITQAGATDATNGGLDTSRQVAVSLRLGIAVADSGSNSIIASGSASGGVVRSGAANATGNDSITEISQHARATGSGSAHLTIEQQATVLNLGVALANSGVNELRGLAGSLLTTTPDELLSEQLFALLLPALLASYADDGAAGAGSISSGAATAVGNQSATYIDQTASATAAGDGTATVQQQVVVANVGGAVANTGGNVHGGASGRELDDRSRQVVAELAAYLNNLVAEINAWNGVSSRAASQVGVSLPLGDLLVGIDSTLTGNLIELGGSADPGGGPGARLRQITAIVSLGIASANTGGNTTVSIAVGSEGAAVATALRGAASSSTTLVTGDARAQNTSLVVICQLDDDLDHPCLRPPSAEPNEPFAESPASGSRPPAVITPLRGDPNAIPPARTVPSVPRTVGAPAAGGRQLPATGTDVQVMLVLATALLIVGGALTRLCRRPVE